MLGLLAGAPVRAEQEWVVRDPVRQRVERVWAEGTVTPGADGARPIVTITTDGRGHPTFVAPRRLGPPVDARGRFVRAVVRVRGAVRLRGLEIRLGSDGFATSWYALPVARFADPEYNFLQDGGWTAVTLGFGTAAVTGAPDRAAIDAVGLVVTDDATGTVEIDLAGIALVDEPREGVVTFTFDDGYAEHLAAARLMAERGWRGTAYVIPQLLGRPAYLTPQDAAELGRLGFDVAAHDDPPFTTVPPAELETRLRGLQAALAGLGFAEGARHLAYPLGKQEPVRVRPTVARLFATARLAGGGPETIPPADPHLLRAVNVLHTTTPAEVGAWARRAKTHREWLILMFHWLPERATKPTDYAMADFRRVLEEVGRSGVRVARLTDVWRQAAPGLAARPPFPGP